jgi:calcineurin-like phosphoesterase family protein
VRKFNDPSIDYYFASDLHIGHANIIKYDKQNYRDYFERDEDIIKNWNAVVRPKDYVFHLGDFGFGASIEYIESVLHRLNGHLFFIKGNHDGKEQIELFKKYGEYLGKLEEITVMKQMITLCHYRMDSWRNSHRGSWHLHGHHHCCHPDSKTKMIIDVGVMGHTMKPLSFSKIKTIMSKKEYVIEYHHDVFTDPSRQ